MAERPPDPPTRENWGLAGPQGTRDLRPETIADERDRYREALEEIVKWSGADFGASKCADIAREALDG